MGNSGSGKSTLLRHLIGLQCPAHGDVLYDGKSFWGMDDESRKVQLRKYGVLFQSGALWSSMTLAENVALQRAPRPALGSISRLWRARGWERAKMDLKTSPNGARGTRNLVAQTESCGVERSPICAGTEAQRERSGDGSSRSKWAIKRNAAVFSLRDKLESGAV
jgi:ABC-type sugar transport system ATPase subunit